jgi:hypothetical protein
MSGVRRYTVMVIEDQIAEEKVIEAFAADRARGGADDPYLELLGAIARNEDDAIEQLDSMPDLPNAILLDDYLPESGEAAGRAVDIMSWLCKRCITAEIPLADRPRTVLWTRGDPELAYTFCVLGGLQVRDKRHVDGEQVPVDAIWAALAGRRWQPEPFPTGLDAERHRAPLPWMEAGWTKKRIAQQLASLGIDEDTMETTVGSIRRMPHTPKAGDDYPSNSVMAIAAAERNGWVWVPLRWHGHIPPGAPLPLVIDPDAHRESLPAAGPLPLRIDDALR